jgi:hypothetical protein
MCIQRSLTIGVKRHPVEIALFATREAGTPELRSLFREPSSGGVKWLESTATSSPRVEMPR